jgi:hypothetical protein
LILGFDKVMSIISTGGRVGRVNGKPYLHLACPMIVRCVLVGSIGTLRMLESRLKVLGDLGVVLETGVIKVARLAARPSSFPTVSPCKHRG